MPERLLHTCPLDRIDGGRIESFAARGGNAPGLVMRVGERVVAWANLCPHWSLPLDHAGPLRLDEEGRLRCASHDARFRADDGVCEVGPCAGQRLDALDVVVRDGIVRVTARPSITLGPAPGPAPTRGEP